MSVPHRPFFWTTHTAHRPLFGSTALAREEEFLPFFPPLQAPASDASPIGDGSGSGGDETLGLDLRLMNGIWGTDVSEPGGDTWPVRVGSLGMKNKACGFNAQGPWLASCARGDADVVSTGDRTTKQRYVVVVAEPDADDLGLRISQSPTTAEY